MDVSDLLKFYSSPLGIAIQERLIDLIKEFWPNLQCDTFICHGFPFPLLKGIKTHTERTAIFMNSHIGVINYLPHGKNVTALIDEDELPLKKDSVDRLILLHSLEYCRYPKDFLREIWRVLSPEGRAIIITPNRRSLWAQLDHTPFGYGTPYSMGQLSQVLKDSQFILCEKKRSLHIFPSNWGNSRMALSMIERFNKTFTPKLSGVVAIEVQKRVYCAPLTKERKRLLITPSPIRARLSSREDLG